MAELMDWDEIKSQRAREYGLWCWKEFQKGWDACEKGIPLTGIELEPYHDGWAACYEAEETLSGKKREWEKSNGL